jgi:hypothetical protein
MAEGYVYFIRDTASRLERRKLKAAAVALLSS